MTRGRLVLPAHENPPKSQVDSGMPRLMASSQVLPPYRSLDTAPASLHQRMLDLLSAASTCRFCSHERCRDLYFDRVGTRFAISSVPTPPRCRVGNWLPLLLSWLTLAL